MFCFTEFEFNSDFLYGVEHVFTLCSCQIVLELQKNDSAENCNQRFAPWHIQCRFVFLLHFELTKGLDECLC